MLSKLKQLLIITTFCLTVLPTHGQTISNVNCLPIVDTIDRQKVLTVEDNMLKFPNGTLVFKYIAERIEYPTEQKDIQEKIFITFIVDTNGKVRNECIYKPYYNNRLSTLEIETLRMISKMPNLNPYKVNGNKIPVRYKIPIRLEFR